MVFLDFEQPIADLYTQLEKLENIGIKGQVDVHTAHDELKRKIKSARKEIYSQLTPWQSVQVSRHPERPYSLFYVEQIADSFIELHGDRKFKDDKSIVGGLAKIEGQSFMIIGHQKGVNTKMRQYRNFGMPNPEGYRKALRLMKMAEKFNIPILTFIDTPGAYPGIEAEERGQAEAIARNLFEMTNLQVPILSYVIGEGASGGAVGIGVADKIFMLQYTWYSVISPEGCASILWRSAEFKEQAAAALKLTAQDMLNFKLIDGVLKEPIGGAHVDGEKMAEVLKEHIIKNVTDLLSVSPEKRRGNRIAKYEKMGRAEFLLENKQS